MPRYPAGILVAALLVASCESFELDTSESERAAAQTPSAAPAASASAPVSSAPAAGPSSTASGGPDAQLFNALVRSDFTAVRAALDAGADPGRPYVFEVTSERKKQNWSVLPLEALFQMSHFPLDQKLETMRLFKQKGADFRITTGSKRSLLFYPLLQGSESEVVPVVHALLEYGCDPSVQNETLVSVNSGPPSPGKEPLPFTILYRGNFAGATKRALFAELARAGASFNQPNASGEPLWQVIVRQQQGDERLLFLESLLQAGMDPNLPALVHVSTTTTVNGRTTKSESDVRVPLLHAVLGGLSWASLTFPAAQERYRLIELLSRHKADFNLLDSRQMTPLETAFQYQKQDPAELETLYNKLTALGADITRPHPGGSGMDSLLRAAELPHFPEIVISALSRMKDLDAPVMLYQKRTALHEVVSKGYVQIVRWLLEHGADANARDKAGRTPLMLLRDYAWPMHDAKRDRERLDNAKQIVDLFIARDADLRVQDKSGTTVVSSLADSDAWADLVKALVAAGADFQTADLEDVTPLWKAVTGKAKATEAFLRSKGARALHANPVPIGNKSEIAQAILAAKLDKLAILPKEDFTKISIRLRSGVPATPLHLAVEQGTTAVVRSLTARGFDWNTGDPYGRSPLTLAILDGRAEAVGLLLEAGADPNHRDKSSETPLSRAVSRHPELLPLFWKRGAHPDGDAFLFKAVYMENLDLLRSLGNRLSPTYELAEAAANLGRPEITDYLLQRAPPGEKTPETLRKDARETARTLQTYPQGKQTAQKIPAASSGAVLKKGNFPWVLKDWSPWIASRVSPPPKLKNYPVYVSIPDNYDPAQSWGLLISMLNPLSKNQYPREGHLAALKKHRLIWVGFDPYFGNPGVDPVFNGTEIESLASSHESYVLAIVYEMLSAFPVDRSRIYLGGFSWGGRLTGEIVPRYPELFTGGIAAGGCFTTGGRAVYTESMDYARKRVSMVLFTGDYDYNRQETWNGYNLFLKMGYRAEYYQAPLQDHAGISPADFETALTFLDEGARTLR